MADRTRGLAYFFKKHGYRRIGILCPNTPAFLESVFAIGAAGGVNVGQSSCVILLVLATVPELSIHGHGSGQLSPEARRHHVYL